MELSTAGLMWLVHNAGHELMLFASMGILLIGLALGVIQFTLDIDPLDALARQGKRAAGYLKGAWS